MPEIDELERSMHALLKNRASAVVERRQMDVSDQAGDFLNAQAGNYMYNFVFMQHKKQGIGRGLAYDSVCSHPVSKKNQGKASVW